MVFIQKIDTVIDFTDKRNVVKITFIEVKIDVTGQRKKVESTDNCKKKLHLLVSLNSYY